MKNYGPERQLLPHLRAWQQVIKGWIKGGEEERGRRVKGSGSGHNLPLDCSISDLALYRVTNCGQVCANEQRRRRRRLQRRQRRRQHDH